MEQVSLGKIGRYDVIRVLGRGGMGEVLLGLDENLNRRVAIKRPLKSAMAEGLARFQIEAKAATLRHPNIPAVYEMGEHDGLPFIAMEFVEGESLEKVIAAKREMDLITKLSIIEQVCAALGYAHSKGVIHRDIKPANIIVQPDGVARIIDFGIAKVQDDNAGSDLTKASQLIGSLHYIAPERFWGGPIDGRVDLFSAGVTLFKLLTGTEPFSGGEATASFKIMNESHSPLGAFLHEYPPALDEIIEKSLAKNPEDRYRTGEDFADALHEVMEDLKRSRVNELFNDAERLATERRFAPALELLDEAIRLDPSNTQARKLRKFVREHQERIRRAERLRESLLRADEALLSGSFDEALTHLRDAQSLDPESAEIKAKIQSVEDKKRRHERSTKALAEAEIAKSRGDINGAMRIITRALDEDAENKKLQAASAALARQLEQEAERGKLLGLLEQAARELAARNLDAAEALLHEAGAIDAANLETDKLRRELSKARELESRRSALAEIEARVHEFLRVEAFDQAADLLSRALEKLPNETTLQRLKAEVDTEARRLQVRRFVEAAIRQAQERFTASPLEALTALQRAINQMPGEERLIAYERTLRQELEAHRSERLRESTVLKARELMGQEEFERAADILESFQVEFGDDADVTALLALARNELAARRRREALERTLGDARVYMREGRLDEAVALLQSGSPETGDATINNLLLEAREQQAALARKLDALKKRVEHLRERDEIDEAVRVLEEQSASAPINTGLQKLLKDLRTERDQKLAVANAIKTAREAAQQHDFPSALDALNTVSRAYGESQQIASAVAQIEEQRSVFAQEEVVSSVEKARACLLKKDPQGALDALKASTAWLEYAGDQNQTEWQKVGLGVKKAFEQSGSSGANGAFDQQFASIATVHPRRNPVGAIGWVAAVLVIATLAIVAILRRPAPQIVVHTQIVLPKVPLGATVRIDGVAQTINQNGGVVAEVKPGPHEVSVTKEGFEAFNDRLDVDTGQSVREEEVKLSELPPVGVPTGSFAVIPQPELPAVKVFVNGELKGEKRSGEKITLPVGSYHVRYRWTGYEDSKDHVIEIAKDGEIQDKILLVKAPTVAKPTPATATGAPPVQQAQATLPPPAPAPAAPPKGSLEASALSIERGQSVTLVWKLENASSGEITDLGKVDAVGFRSVSPSQTTTYQLTVNGSQLAEARVEVREVVKAAASAPSQPVVSAPSLPAGPDKSVLQQAVMAGYASVFSRASGKSSKDCKAAFTGVYGGKLKDFTSWCDLAKSFTPAEQCSQVGGTMDAPLLTCVERVAVRLKDGGTQDFPPQSKTFRFGKSTDGSWIVIGW